MHQFDKALARLREYVADQLLVQVGRRMDLTPRAEGLQEAVRDVLLRVDSTSAIQPAFDAARSDRVFRIFVSDYTQLVFVPHLLALAHAERCSVGFGFLPQVAHPPLPITPMEQGVQWHKYRTQDPGLTWLRQLLRRAAVRMDAQAAA